MHGCIILLLRKHGLLNKNFRTRHVLPTYEKILVRNATEVAKIRETIVIALGCHPMAKIAQL